MITKKELKLFGYGVLVGFILFPTAYLIWLIRRRRTQDSAFNETDWI